ncbi:MAG: hypothetical protein GY806_14920 [Gammaproteobacteria bacterium]|nr:hypothetical protein [Gammaproteobacteria bacterium]
MFYLEDTETNENTDMTGNRQLILDGTANLDYYDDDQISRVKSLVELLGRFFGNK